MGSWAISDERSVAHGPRVLIFTPAPTVESPAVEELDPHSGVLRRNRGGGGVQECASGGWIQHARSLSKSSRRRRVAQAKFRMAPSAYAQPMFDRSASTEELKRPR